MRISDWSADVCSSDLCPVCSTRTPSPNRPSPPTPRQPPSPGRPRKPKKNRPTPKTPRTRPSHTAPDEQPTGTDPVPVATSRHNQPVHPAWHPSGSPGRIVLQRSEEHTSELQSLMRISYAVFCLKKKKHNINNNKHTTT